MDARPHGSAVARRGLTSAGATNMAAVHQCDAADLARCGRDRYRDHRSRPAQGALARGGSGARSQAARSKARGAFHQLINPREPIPAFSTAIHGIDNEKVADAPVLRRRCGRNSGRYLGDAVVIGHTLGFDLAMLQQECKRAGIAWRDAASLDTQHLVAARRSAPSPAIRSRSSRTGSGSRSPTGIPRWATPSPPRGVFQALLPKLRDERHPHLCGSSAGLPRAHRRARPAISRRLGDAGCGARPRWRRADAEPDRQLSVSPPHPRRDVVAAEDHRCRPDAWRSADRN